LGVGTGEADLREGGREGGRREGRVRRVQANTSDFLLSWDKTDPEHNIDV